MFDEPLLKSFLSLISLVGVLGIALFLLKRYTKKAKSKYNGIELNIISKTSVQAKSQLCIVQAGSKTLLLGITDHNITTLSDLTEDKTRSSFVPAKQSAASVKAGTLANQPVANKSNNRGNPLSFRNFLSTIVKKQNKVQG